MCGFFMISSPARLRLVCQLVRLQHKGLLASMPMAELARRTGMTRQMLGNILNDYAFKGWIRIHCHQSDQRSRMVELLPAFWFELRRDLGPLLNEDMVPVACMQIDGHEFSRLSV